MSIPARPIDLHQGPASACVIGGQQFGWLNCTPTSFAMGVTKATLGAKHPTGCDVRLATGDRSGGTTIPQCAKAVEIEYGIKTECHTGSGAASPATVAAALRAGRGVVAQGNTRVLIHTDFRSTGGPVNHAVYVNEGKDWVNGYPGHVLVYDPAADGRRASWGTADDGPSWWPWATFKAFCAALQPWADARVLGPGRIYAAFFPDTEPHVHIRYHASRTVPFPDRVVVNVPAGRRANVRSRPDSLDPAYIVATLPDDAPWTAYQRVRGATPKGSTSNVWYGDHNGTRWIHVSNLARIGGAS